MENNDLEKVVFTVWLVKRLLAVDKKILAIGAVKRLYKCGLKDAKEFVEAFQITAEEEFIKAVMRAGDAEGE